MFYYRLGGFNYQGDGDYRRMLYAGQGRWICGAISMQTATPGNRQKLSFIAKICTHQSHLEHYRHTPEGDSERTARSVVRQSEPGLAGD